MNMEWYIFMLLCFMLEVRIFKCLLKIFFFFFLDLFISNGDGENFGVNFCFIVIDVNIDVIFVDGCFF